MLNYGRVSNINPGYVSQLTMEHHLVQNQVGLLKKIEINTSGQFDMCFWCETLSNAHL